MRQVDIIAGFVALLMSSEPLKTWVCEEENGVARYNIYGPPIPEIEKIKRNNGLIVIDEAGGPGPEEYDPHAFNRIECRLYGSGDFSHAVRDARKLDRFVMGFLDRISDETHAGVRIFSVQAETLAMDLIEGGEEGSNSGFPFVLRNYLVSASQYPDI